MSTRTKRAFGHECFALCSQLLLAAAAAGVVGCATSGSAIDRVMPGIAMAQGTRGMDDAAGLRVGETQLVDGHVNPMVPVRLTVDGGEIAIRFGHPRSRQEGARAPEPHVARAGFARDGGARRSDRRCPRREAGEEPSLPTAGSSCAGRAATPSGGYRLDGAGLDRGRLAHWPPRRRLVVGRRRPRRAPGGRARGRARHCDFFGHER